MTTKYSEDHEWLELEQDNIAMLGITSFANQQLGDLVYIELPDIGDKINKGDNIAVIESVKAASDLVAPVSGEVVAINERLSDEPELASVDNKKDSWFIKLKLSDNTELEKLMDDASYQDFINR